MNNKLLRNLIIILIVVIAIIFVVLFIIFNNSDTKGNINNNTVQEENTTNEDGLNGESTPEELNAVNKEIDYQTFFTISNCISQYLDVRNMNNSNYYGRDDNGNMVLNVTEDEIQKILKSLLSTNLKKDVPILQEKNIFTLVQAIRIIEANVDSYAVYGFTMNENNEYLKDMYFIVNLDKINNTFSIEELDGNYSDLNQISTNALESIEKNDYNTFSYQDIDEQYRYKKYLAHYKKILLGKPQLAFEYLDENYKNQRFGDYEYFTKYIQENRDIIKTVSPTRYKENNDNNEITIIDQYDNSYTFDITGTMQYKVKLDDYIILSESDIEKYNSYGDSKKVSFNINRWVKMLNSKDYKFAYEYLDKTFRENTFGSVEKFEQYMKEKYPMYYDDISYEDRAQEGNLYTVELELTNSKEEFSDKYMTIIMKLGEGTDFSLSFTTQ